MTNNGRAYEARTTGDKKFFRNFDTPYTKPQNSPHPA